MGNAEAIRRGRECEVGNGATIVHLETDNTGVPVEGTVDGYVLRRVKERAVIRRINCHSAIVAPAAQGGSLRATSAEDHVFRFQGPRRIRGRTPGYGNFRVNRAARFAVAGGDVAAFIRGDAAHPPPIRIGLKCPLLKYCRRAVRAADFIPAHAGYTVDRDGVIENDGFMIAKVAVGHPVIGYIADRGQ